MRPIRLVVAFPAGGTTDFVARLVAERAGALIGQPIVVENRPGGNGAIAAETVARAEPDGHSLFFSTVGALAINPGLRADLSYDPLKDFAPVGMVAVNTTVLAVRTTLGVNSAQEFAARARQRPNTLSVAITGVGAISHMATILFEAAAGVRLLHVPYRGAAPALNDLLGGQLDGMTADVPVLLSTWRGGKIRALAVGSRQRSDAMPDVPTFVEQGYDAVADNWCGVLAPAGTPAPVIARLNRAFTAAVDDDLMQRRLREAGVSVAPGSPAEFAATIASEIVRWGKVVKDKGIRPD